MLCMILTFTITSYAETDDYQKLPFIWMNTEEEITEDDWYYSAACHIWEDYDSLFSFKFSPTRQVKRIELAAYMTSLDHEWTWFMSKFEANPFTDLESYSNNRRVLEIIDWAYNFDIIEGISETEFSPDGYLTREQLAVFMYRLSNHFLSYDKLTDDYAKIDVTVKASIDAFPDASEVSDFAVEAMEWAYGTELMIGKGTPDGVLLSPKDTLTHAELMNVMYRYTLYFTVDLSNSIIVI